jgi:hypothetical protein
LQFGYFSQFAYSHYLESKITDFTDQSHCSGKTTQYLANYCEYEQASFNCEIVPTNGLAELD